MEILFNKYQGTGNDFILIDNRDLHFPNNKQLIEMLCNRRFGIGADGLLLLQNEPGYDFRMIYYNSDGAEATFCGNGGRCIAAFANSLGETGTESYFIAADGQHKATLERIQKNEWRVSLGMKSPQILRESFPVYFLNTGTYHVVKFVEDPDMIDILTEGPAIRYDNEYAPHGTNANFVKVNGENIHIRTYEKGVEAETLSCGTGSTAAAIAASLYQGGNHFHITTKGGELEVDFKCEGSTFWDIILTGPVSKVFTGKITV